MMLRIDHFRDLMNTGSFLTEIRRRRTAIGEKGPGYELFDVMKKKLGRKKVIAEDLGFLTPA